MSATELKRLAQFSAAVRESTLKRLRAVPENLENWRIAPDAMSFADIAGHLIDADQWLFKKIEIKNLKPILGRAGAVHIENRTQYLNLLDKLDEIGKRREEFILSLREKKLSEKIYDSRFGGEVTVWWIIVRGNLDHEIHHRGQVAAYLRTIMMIM